jgi:glycosyltransferase involved in cell wall biosynthesis
VVVFNHAECHLLGSYLPLPSVLAPHSLGVMSLFQSPQLYPQKILPRVIPGLEKVSRNLCYSSNVVTGWEKITNARLVELPLGVRIEKESKIELPSKSNVSSQALKILHIGRDTPWKRPEHAAIFALEIATLGIKVELHFIGITENDEISMYAQDPNMKIHFHGLLERIDSELLDSDIIVNLFDCSLSLESIGLGALEALTMAKSVVIEKESDTSFKNLFGIYEKDKILETLTKNVQQSRPLLENISVTEVEYKKNLMEISISTYAFRFLSIIDEFGKSSIVKKIK